MAAATPNPVICTCLAVRQAARHISQLYDMWLAPAGLKVTQYSILSKLKHMGPISIGALAIDLVLDRTTLKRNLAPLERDGLVYVGSDNDNPRAKSIKLTALGNIKIEEARILWHDAQKTFESRFGKKRTVDLQILLHAATTTDLGTIPVDAP